MTTYAHALRGALLCGVTIYLGLVAGRGGWVSAVPYGLGAIVVLLLFGCALVALRQPRR